MSWSFLLGNVTGIIALGVIAKAILHLPPPTSHGTGSLLLLLTAGRIASSLVPIRFTTARHGLGLLGLTYLVSATLEVLIGISGPGWQVMIGLGMALGTTNLLAWALLPLLARGPRDYGLYTMASKLALGLSGFVMTAALGRTSVFEQAGFVALCIGAATASCIAALMLAIPARLTYLAPE